VFWQFRRTPISSSSTYFASPAHATSCLSAVLSRPASFWRIRRAKGGASAAVARLGCQDPASVGHDRSTVFGRLAFPAPDGLEPANYINGKDTHLRMSALFVCITDDVIRHLAVCVLDAVGYSLTAQLWLGTGAASPSRKPHDPRASGFCPVCKPRSEPRAADNYLFARAHFQGATATPTRLDCTDSPRPHQSRQLVRQQRSTGIPQSMLSGLA
jgi:hypothetical protein